MKKINSAVLHSIDYKIASKSTMVDLLKAKCTYMYHTGKPFTLLKTGSNYNLVSNYFNAKAHRASSLTPSDLSFIKAVKKHIMNSNIAADFIDCDYQAKKISYIDIKEFSEGECINDVIEVDLNSAYWETAYNLGFLPDNLYRRGYVVSKLARLVALGSLAKRTEKWVFDGKEIKKGADIRSVETENLWFAICKRVSDVMQKAVDIAGDDFVFYWVDGIYIKRNTDTLSKIIAHFIDCGYESKCKDISEIVFTGKEFTVTGKNINDKRTFAYPTKAKENERTIKKYNENKKLEELAKKYFNVKKKEKK